VLNSHIGALIRSHREPAASNARHVTSLLHRQLFIQRLIISLNQSVNQPNRPSVRIALYFSNSFRFAAYFLSWICLNRLSFVRHSIKRRAVALIGQQKFDYFDV